MCWHALLTPAKPKCNQTRAAKAPPTHTLPARTGRSRQGQGWCAPAASAGRRWHAGGRRSPPLGFPPPAGRCAGASRAAEGEPGAQAAGRSRGEGVRAGTKLPAGGGRARGRAGAGPALAGPATCARGRRHRSLAAPEGCRQKTGGRQPCRGAAAGRCTAPPPAFRAG